MSLDIDFATVLAALPKEAKQARDALMRIRKEALPANDGFGFAKEVVRAFYLNGKKTNRWKNKSEAARELTDVLNGTDTAPGILQLLADDSESNQLEQLANHHETSGYSRTVYDWIVEIDKADDQK